MKIKIKEVAPMKRVFLFLTVTIMALFVSVSAFAAETESYFHRPTAGDYDSRISGGTVEGVEDYSNGGLTDDQRRGLILILSGLEYEGIRPSSVKVARVHVALSSIGSSGGITYEWDDYEVLWNYSGGYFDYSDYSDYIDRGARGEAAESEPKVAATTSVTIRKDGVYSDKSVTASNRLAFISAMASVNDGGGGGGCSALTLGALGLFLAPLAAVAVRRGRKQLAR